MSKTLQAFAGSIILLTGLSAHAGYQCTAYAKKPTPRHKRHHGYGHGRTLEGAKAEALRNCRIRNNIINGPACRITSCSRE